MAQSQQLLVIDANSFAPVQTDAISGVTIDKIGVDPSRRPCARIKMHINRMTKEDIAGISVRPVGGSVVVTKQIVATEGNGLIVEMTAKAPTRFYLHHAKYGDSNEVSLNLEGDKEYKLEAMLNTTHSIVLNSNTIGADVYVDDIFKGNITGNYNLTISDIYPGKHKIKVKMGGLESENEVDVNPLNIQFRINLESVKAQFVVFSVSPKDASVIIDGKDEVPDKDGFVVLTKNNGTYSYTISAKDYHEERGQFTVSGSKVEKSISLRPAFGWLRVSGQGVLQGASVYVDGELIGKAPVTSDKISSGEHSVRIVKNLYKTSVERIVIEDNKHLDYAPELVADFARVTINAGEGSNIYINDKHKGESPWSGDLASGTYVFEARKNGHRTTSISKTIEATPSKQSYPVMADIHIDGKSVGKTPLEQSILIGTHKVTVSKDGYQSQEKAITISEGKAEEVEVTLQKETDKAVITPNGLAKVTIKRNNGKYVYVDGVWKGTIDSPLYLKPSNMYYIAVSDDRDHYYAKTIWISPNSANVFDFNNAIEVSSPMKTSVSSSTNKSASYNGGAILTKSTKKKSRSGWNSFNVGVYADMALISYDDSLFGMGVGANWRLFKYNSVLIPTIGARYMYGFDGSHTVGFPIILNLNWWKLFDDSFSWYFGIGVEPVYMKDYALYYDDYYGYDNYSVIRDTCWYCNLVFNLVGFGWRHHDVNMYFNYTVGLGDFAFGLRYSYFF